MIKPLLIIILLFECTTSATAQNLSLKTGEFTKTSTVLELMGETDGQNFADKISITDPIEWEVYVPQNYSPDNPAGILVFINSRDSGKIEEEWRPVMDHTNLIYIGANNAGNQVAIPRRIAFAIMAPKLISNAYNVNPDRVYLSGFSGGSRVASLVATEYNNLFKGAVYNSGVNYWGDAARDRYEEMKDNNYVFITGTEDFNLDDTQEVFKNYREVGMKNIKLIIVPDMAHKRPSAEILESGINYLDSTN
jgi:dienelactone hydrolase